MMTDSVTAFFQEIGLDLYRRLNQNSPSGGAPDSNPGSGSNFSLEFKFSDSFEDALQIYAQRCNN